MIVKLARWSAMLVSLCIGWPLAAQEMSAETRERLCAERRTALARLEQEAPQLRLEADTLARKIAAAASPDRVRNAELELQRWRRMHSTAKTPADRTLFEAQIRYWDLEARSHLDLAGRPRTFNGTWTSPFEGILLDQDFAELQKLSQRQTYVAGQISVLREGMESLRCATRPANVDDLSGKWVARLNFAQQPGKFQEYTLTVGPWQNGQFSGPLVMTSTNAPEMGWQFFNQHVIAIRPSGPSRYSVQQTGRIVPIDQSGRTEVVPSEGAPVFASFDGRTLTIPLLDPPLAFVKVSR